MLDYTGGPGIGNILAPTIIPTTKYSGIPLEVRSASSTGGANGLSTLALRTTTNLYVFGTAANITTLTTMAGFGGLAINTPTSDVTAKLPAGVLITDIAQMAMSPSAFAIVTNTGEVWVLTQALNMQGDNAAAATPAVWHHVVVSGGVTGVGPYLTGVTKISISGSGILATTAANKLFYWGSPANVAGIANTTTSYKFAFDMSAQIPAGKIVKDVVVLGTKAPSASTLFLLCNDNKVYVNGLNTNGCLGNNIALVTTNQPTFITVKGTDGVTDLANIVKIDGDTEGDLFCMGAQSTTGQIFGWGNSQAAMLGVNAGTGSFDVPKTTQLFVAPAPVSNFTDFSIAGHFTIAFFSSGGIDQYWYLGHQNGGSVGDNTTTNTFLLAANPISINSSGGVTFDCSIAVLPLTWLSFTAQKQSSYVLLNWSTASEQNTKDFLVQFSIDGISWRTINTVLSAGNSSSVKNYSYLHTNPVSSINYYRILQQDFDGNKSYSTIVKILYASKAKQLTVYPTEVVDGKINLQLQQAAAIKLYNSIGELVLSKQMPAGTNTLNVNNFAKGMYMLQAGTETAKFMIQ